MNLDTATLFTVAITITGLLGIFLIVLWLQERNVRALAWWGAAYLVGASAVALWGTKTSATYMTSEAPSALLLIACGMIWMGARLFHGRPLLPGGLFCGAIVWYAAMEVPSVAGSDRARVVLCSLMIAAYAFLTAYELRRERRQQLAARWASFAVPVLHGCVFLAPVALGLLTPIGTTDGLFALFALETVLYVVGTAFVVVVMAKERVALVHKTAAMTDLLTGIFNRRAFYDAANLMMTKRGRKGLPVTVLLFDLDHFKSINDRFGHAIGDDTLKVFAKTASTSLRGTDVVARLGGEEFVAILPGNAAEAAIAAERVRAAYQAAGVEISSQQLNSTVSIGIATAKAPVEIDALIARADAALYAAKHNGRNRVEHAPEGEVAAAPKSKHEPKHAPATRPAPALAGSAATAAA